MFMSRHVKIKHIGWSTYTGSPVYGDCIGVATVPDKVWPVATAWWNYSFETINEAEYGTLVAFGIDVLDLETDPPAPNKLQDGTNP